MDKDPKYPKIRQSFDDLAIQVMKGYPKYKENPGRLLGDHNSRCTLLLPIYLGRFVVKFRRFISIQRCHTKD